jgi:hypothetical protein
MTRGLYSRRVVARGFGRKKGKGHKRDRRDSGVEVM